MTLPLPSLCKALGLALAAVLFTGPLDGQAPATVAERAALYDYLLDTVLRREAFSPYKDAHFGANIVADLRALRGEFLAADTDEKLYYAVVRFSNARRDAHLEVRTVPGGVAPSFAGPALHAPVKAATDFGRPGEYSLFVADVAPAQLPADADVEVGDLIVRINGRDVAAHAAAVTPYLRPGTLNNLWYYIARILSEKSALLPPELRADRLELVLERKGGARRTVVLPYLDPASLAWAGHSHDEREYPGFAQVYATPTHDLYRHESRPVLLLQWHNFSGTLIRDTDRLVEWAKAAGALGHDLIVDQTRGWYGSLGAYAIQRLTSRSFKTTFGNLRISDVTARFAEQARDRLESRRQAGRGPETINDGTWLIQWLEDDVAKGIADGQAYTNNVPFKLAHAPKWSDGILHPAPLHFTGRMVVLGGPHGGSHLDQFMSIIKDNQLGHIIGLPAGGYSNTWEWEEVVTIPGTGRPVVSFMWNIGHTIRPNGQVLECNPALPDDVFPPSRENHLHYYSLLIARALAWLEAR